MNLNELKIESKTYMEYQQENNKIFFAHYKNIIEFCKALNEKIPQKLFLKMNESYKYFNAIEQGKIKGKMTIDEVIDVTENFFNNISNSLKEKFRDKYNQGEIKIGQNHPNKCIYFSKTVDGIQQHGNIVYINHSGTIFDVIILVHEFFHSLTDVINFKKEINIDKEKLDYIQETTSIIAELICVKYLETSYPTESKMIVLARIFEEVYQQYRQSQLIFRYHTSLMNGIGLEELKTKFPINELREFMKNKKTPMSTSHFLGTMSALTQIKEENNLNHLLKNIYDKINNEDMKDIDNLIPMRIDINKVLENITLQPNFQNSKMLND